MTGDLSRSRHPAALCELGALNAPLSCPMGARTYGRQYASLYFIRLKTLRRRLIPRAEERWGTRVGDFASSQSQNQNELPVYVERILEVKAGQACYIVGTLYCAMHLKPDVLEDLTRDQYLPAQPIRDKIYDTDRDEIFVEDESGRVRLVGSTLTQLGKQQLRGQCVTGVVVGVLGTETANGDFEVADFIFPGLPAANSAADEEEVRMMEDGDDDQWVALVSGLNVGASSDSKVDAEGIEGSGMGGQELKLELLSEWLAGELGDAEDLKAAARISNLIIAGNSVSMPQRQPDDLRTNKAKFLHKIDSPTEALDLILHSVASTMDIHLLPGAQDPSSIAMPQQPLHPALLPKAVALSSLHRCTNPAWIGIGGRKLLGTSGQNVDDIFKYLEGGDEDRTRMAASSLEWGHMAPTAPDTLWCYPFMDRDPFLLNECPDVYFVGNQPRFDSLLHTTSDGRRVRIIMVPSFSESGQVVLLNMRTLDTKACIVGLSA